jgi:hypothetical protein
VVDHPGEYLHHRWRFVEALVGLAPHVCYPHHFQIDPNPFGVRLADSVWNRETMRLLNAVHDSVLFRGWIYLLVLAAVAVASGLRRSWAAFALAASGVLYFLPFALLAPSCDFRYLWWSVLCTLAFPLAMAADRKLARRRPAVADEALAGAGTVG